MRALAAAALTILVLAGCGGPSAPGGTTRAVAPAEVQVSGNIAAAGTRGSILVYAFSDTLAADAVAQAAPVSVSTVAADGSFALSVPPSPALTLAFLADGASDGVIDGGDPVVVLSDGHLVDLQAGDSVQITDLNLDFHAVRAHAASIDVQRAGAPEPAVTPTAIPPANS